MKRLAPIEAASLKRRGVLCLSLSIVAAVVGSARADTMVYVSTLGNDAWSGTLASPNEGKTEGPFASVARARDAIRQMKARQGELREPVHVQIRGGAK